MIDRQKGLLKGPIPPNRFMADLHPVEADLDLMNSKFFCNLLRNQCSIRQED